MVIIATRGVKLYTGLRRFIIIPNVLCSSILWAAQKVMRSSGFGLYALVSGVILYYVQGDLSESFGFTSLRDGVGSFCLMTLYSGYRLHYTWVLILIWVVGSWFLGLLFLMVRDHLTHMGTMVLNDKWPTLLNTPWIVHDLSPQIK